jgi:DNA mismatch repair ATPase MutS
MTADDNNNGKPKVFKKYFIEQEKYSKIYGEKTIVFFEMGKFYDAYCTKTKGYLKLAEFEPLLNIHFIRREENSKKNPYNKPNQFGIPTVSIKKNLTTLVENGYTIVIFDQKKNGDTIERECVGVFSPGTYVSDRQLQDANYIMSVYIAEEKQLAGQKTLMAIGLTIIDVTTGNSMVHEFYSNKLDERFGLDELVRTMQTFRPIEIVIYYHPVEMDETVIKNIKLYLELEKFKNNHFYIYHNKKGNDELKLLSEDMFKINFQNDFLAKIYNFHHQVSLHNKLSPIEILQLEQKSYVIISLMIILKYIGEHNVILLKNLSYPDIYIYNKHLILGNNAIEQLNILDSNNLEVYNQKFKSVFDVINKTSTPMGRRFLKENLLNPMSQENKQNIIRRYDMIEELLKEKLFKSIKEELKSIYDIERLHRRMAMGTITPYEFYRLDLFYQSTIRIIGLIKDNKILRSIIPDATIKEFISYQIEYNKEYNFELLQNHNNFNGIDHSFFKKGIHEDIDKIQEKIDYVWSMINSISQYLLNLVSGKCKKMKNKEILEMDSNERDGYYFTITKANEKILKTELNKKKGQLKIFLSVGQTLEIDKADIEFKQLPKGRSKIFIAPLVEHTVNLSVKILELTKLIEKIFIKSMVNYFSKNKIMMHKISKFVSEMDFLVSGAIVADEFYYCKPMIPSAENIPSYLKTKSLRHAIIERLCNETEYIPNDIDLGNVPNETGHRCLHPNTKIIMFDGSITKAKFIKKGDELMGDDSTARTVLDTCTGKACMYKIIPTKGDPFIVNGAHILCLKSSGYKSVMWGGDKADRYRAAWMENHKNKSKSFSVKIYDTKENAYIAAKEFLKTVPSDRGKIIKISVDNYLKKPPHWRINYYLYRVGVKFPEQEVNIDPYILGHWLGDGWSAGTGFSTADPEIVAYYKEYFDGTGVVVNHVVNYDYRVTTNVNIGGKGRNWYLNCLKEYDLINNKHIPTEYLFNSRKVRMAVLAGLIDSDGSNSNDRGFDIVQKNENLADDIVYLVRSLGYWCEKHPCQKTCTNSKNGPVTGTYYQMYICGSDFSKLPLLLEYKRPHPENKTVRFDNLISSFKVKKLGMGDYCGFELDGNHKFLLGDYTVSHNSKIDSASKKNDIDDSQEKTVGKNGMLLFSINSAGKSTCMKAIGIAIILAQIGYYVPAEEFIYEPYMALYARITGNDNLFKGLSSFALEMTELNAILLRTETQGTSTIVIGDEVCRGTEDTSGLALVASSLVSLSECGATFIFATHLHDLPKIDEVKKLTNLRLFHLRVEYDEENNCLVFDRKLTPGSGPRVYGLAVAKYIIKNMKFINRAEIIKKRLLNEDKFDIPTKTSNYNKDLLVKSCNICDYVPKEDYYKELESHHIHFQKNCWTDGKIKEKPYLNKNKLYNLVVLCRKCHNKVHKGEIIIKGYADTSIGPLLDYHIDIKKTMINGLEKLEQMEKKKGSNNNTKPKMPRKNIVGEIMGES